MEPIRILNLFTIMNRGGAETMVMNYYRHIDRNKVQFDFMVHRVEKGAYDDEIIALGGRIYYMIPIYPQNFLKYKNMLRKFFINHKEYQIIHSHMSELGYFVFKEAKKQGVPIRICHAHNAPLGFDMKLIFRNYFKSKMLPYITHMFICSLAAGNWLYGSKYHNKFIMMNNAIDAQKYIFSSDKSFEIRKKLGLEGKFVIGHVGRFEKQKNHEMIIDIFKNIYKINLNSRLLLVGDGDLRDQVESKAKDLGLSEVIICTGVSSEVPDLMQAMDVFLFPSFYEGLPVTLVEAQAAGLPCFISDVITDESILTDNVTKITLSNKPEIWANIILKKVIEFRRRNMYEKIVEAKFDIKENAYWLEEFYLGEYGKI